MPSSQSGPLPPASLPQWLQAAEAHAAAGRFDAMQAECGRIMAAAGDDPDACLGVGVLLLGAGFLAGARTCFQRGRLLAPQDLRPLVNLANVAREAGEHAEARRLYAALLQALPDNAVVRRNALISLEYDDQATDAERRAQAESWGAWAIARAGGPLPRPPAPPIGPGGLRVGYVSADICQHTAGLFALPVLRAHAAAGMEAFVYSAGAVRDWVTDAVRAATRFRDVARLDDAALAARIRRDRLHVLVDLSGHTAGSRLAVFAHRPAPVQVSWLGYFATTGLGCMDAVLLDDWHAPPGTEAQFVEPFLRLPPGRLCYQPVPFAPAEVAPPPCLAGGCVTFGSFNNTAKLNPAVMALWARVLAAVPGSRLMLKWRTFNDSALRQKTQADFAAHGIAPNRVLLSGPSFHVDLLRDYAGIDIALDPFPFTGGLTSCEALWMGVPLVTWPQSRVVSRQGVALLSAIGVPEWAAADADGYVRIAAGLAADPARLAVLRQALRGRMLASPLMDVAGFVSALRSAFQVAHRRSAGGQHCGAAGSNR